MVKGMAGSFNHLEKTPHDPDFVTRDDRFVDPRNRRVVRADNPRRIALDQVTETPGMVLMVVSDDHGGQFQGLSFEQVDDR
jgi:hypothetical protein